MRDSALTEQGQPISIGYVIGPRKLRGDGSAGKSAVNMTGNAYRLLSFTRPAFRLRHPLPF